MRGVLLDRGQLRVSAELPAPRPANDECIVDVTLAGVCATDLALRRGYMGFRGVPGHEFVGVARSGPLAERRVVGEINAGCGCCENCRAGDSRHCEQRTVLGILGRDGAFAERLVLPIRNLCEVSDSISDLQAVFAEPLAAALQLRESLPELTGSRVLIAGDGRLGLLCAWAVAESGAAEVVVAGRHEDRDSLLPTSVPLRSGLLEADPPPRVDRRFDIAVEATGSAEVLPRLLRWVRPRGRIALKTTTERPLSLDLAPFVVDEITLIGSRCGRLADALQRLGQEPRIPLERFVHARYGLENAEEAFAHAERPGVLKVLIDPTQ